MSKSCLVTSRNWLPEAAVTALFSLPQWERDKPLSTEDMSRSDGPGADRSTHEVVRGLRGAGILSKKLLGLSYSGLQS